MRTNTLLLGACGLLLALPTVAAEAAAPTVGAETLVAPNAGTSKAQFNPTVAFNGEVYMVVWQDGAGSIGDAACEIWAVRLDKSGKLLDANGILVCKAEGKEARKKPVVAACGKDFLVAWEDYRNGKDQDVYAARVTGEGKVLDPGGFAVSAKPGAQVRAAVASDGKTGWLVTWSDFRSGDHYEVYAARVSAEGKVLEPDGLAIATGKDFKPCYWDSSVAWTGKSYLVVWMSARVGDSCQVTPDGKVLNPVANNKGGTEFLGHKSGSFTAWLLGDKRPRLAAGPDGLLVAMHNVFGKDGGYTGPWFNQAIFLDAEGKPRIPANKETLPKAVGGEFPNPGWVMEPVPDPFAGKFGGTPWNPCPAALGKDWLVVLQKQITETRPGHPRVLRDDIIAARVLADGACPDRASPLVIDANESYSKINPACCSGPEGEVLVVYERQKAAGDLKVAARIVKR